MSERNPQPRDRMRGGRLRAIRKELLGLTLEQAAAKVGWHGSKMSRTENGQRPVSIEDFTMLITAWGVPAKKRDEILAELAETARSGWWDRPIPGVPEEVGTLASYEADAVEMVSVATGVVPGLLQTHDYGIAVMRACGAPAEDVERMWMARVQRQRVLTRVDYTTYVAESALRTPYGGVAAFREQLQHLLRGMGIGQVVRVVPEAQTEVALLVTWMWMRFPHTPPVAYVELPSGAVFDHDAASYTKIIAELDRVSLPKSGSRNLITSLLKGLDDHDVEEVQQVRTGAVRRDPR
jgi:transcriptional regulator with XRE-family HTH domain